MMAGRKEWISRNMRASAGCGEKKETKSERGREKERKKEKEREKQKELEKE